MEKLCGSIGLSLILLYLATWAYYCLVPDIGVLAYASLSAISLALGIISRKDVAVLVRSFRVRQTLYGYLFLLVWTLLILGMIRVYSGATWGGDWAEHFQRTLFFLHRFPSQTLIIGGYQLPARPPMMNVLAAFFLAQTKDRFEIFQIVFSSLNLLMLLPCCLIIPALGGRRRRDIFPLVALFALSPIVMQAVTYTWTRGVTTYFVVSAFAFYLAGWRKNDPIRMATAFIALSAGILVHYSAGPYTVFLCLHYMACVFPGRERKWQELATITLCCTLLLATWFGWSIATYGTRITFGSNTTVTSNLSYGGGTIIKTGENIYHSLVPAIVRDTSILHVFDQPSFAGFIRDNVFIFYESNVIFSMGLAGGPLILCLLYRYRQRPGTGSAEHFFWLAMIPFCVLLGIGVVGEADKFGVAHITLLSLEVLGLSMLASSLPLPKIAMVFLITGCAVDFSLGVLLHARIEGLENSPKRTYYASPTPMGNQFLVVAPPGAPSTLAWDNWLQKHQYALSQEWLNNVGDSASLQKGLQTMASYDDVLWHGWFKRNGGSMVYLGDHLTGLSFDGKRTLQLFLFILLGYMLWLLRKQRHQS